MLITFAHQKGGVGKSTLCLNVALAFANRLSVGIVDIDPQGSIRDITHLLSPIHLIPTPTTLTTLQNLPYDLICIDTPPYLSDRLKEIFLVSDVILIPTKASVFDVLAIRRTVEYVQKAQQERPTLKGAIVLNMIKAGSTLTAEGQKILNEYDLPILSTQISERVSYARSPLTNGIIGSDDSKAKQEITSLCTEIVNLIHGKA